ncbi:Asd/ArgC dimerization domain-containing protein [Amantichitinum ursilacus]|uniref:Aspartate-semialdehyde dehydrogenase 2 n=1 Tax=Amantichitinum ursilacus TaxID=857265 RepID=A0A0N0XII5_9NEIS|nr:Asd/ArgC dimerization domain-containing protein [Amantichitinum ursilacus]KPC52931.1 Aspartate-semialdehyde dehydrogenase 2 [Amantichitinum ursilacus]
MSAAPLKLAIFGAHGPFGDTLLEVLAESPVSVDEIFALAADEDGSVVTFRGEDTIIEAAAGFDWSQASVAVFAGSRDEMKQYAPAAKAAGCRLLDATAPLASFAVLARPLAALNGLSIARAHATLMESASSQGQGGVDTLSRQTRALFANAEIENGAFAKRLAFNLFPLPQQQSEHIRNVVNQQLGAPLLDSVQRVQVPLFFGHGATLAVRLIQETSKEAVIAALRASSGLFVLDAEGPAGIATPQDVIGADLVWISQVEVSADGKTVTLWAVVDNARLGAMAVVAELLGAARH